MFQSILVQHAVYFERLAYRRFLQANFKEPFTMRIVERNEGEMYQRVADALWAAAILLSI